MTTETRERVAIRDCCSALNIAEGALRNATASALDAGLDRVFVKELLWAVIAVIDLCSKADALSGEVDE